MTLSAQAQFEKILHQTFDVEEYNQIDFDFAGEYEIEQWAGNVVLTETKVQLYDASRSIFDYYVNKAERYKIKSEDKGKSILIRNSQAEKKSIRTKTGECYEIVKMRVFVPEDFTIASQTKLTRKNPKGVANQDIDQEEMVEEGEEINETAPAKTDESENEENGENEENN